MISETTGKRLRLRAPYFIALFFLFYIGYLGLCPISQLLENTKSVLREECSPSEYISAVDTLYSGMLSTEASQPLLKNKGSYINFNGLMARLLSQPMMNERVTLKNGHLAHIISQPVSQEAIKATAENITSFAQMQESRGGKLLFVVTASQVSKYEDLLPAGYTDTANETADTLLALLSENGTAYLDLRECLHADGITQADAFFKTDHHWKPQTGLWAYGKILQSLETMGCIGPVNRDYSDSDHFDFVTFENTFLGSSGKRTGIYYAGLDDSVFIRPKFDTQLTLTIPDRSLSLGGRYEDVVYNTNRKIDFNEINYFSFNAYGLYGWGDNGLNQWRNEHAPEKARVMLIGDSFGNIPFSLMSLYFSSCDELDMRYYSGDFSAHFAEFQPDIVIMVVALNQITAENTRYPFVSEQNALT